MKEKLILIFYLPQDVVGEVNSNGLDNQLNDYLKNRMGEENLPVVFYLPTDGSPRVECLNPVVLNEEQYKEYDKIITIIKDSEKFKNLNGEQTNN